MAKRIRRILYATDFSKASSRALEQAVDMARHHGAELVVLHVIEPAMTYMSGDDLGSADLYARLEEAAQRDAEASMKKLMQKLEKSKIKAKSLLLKGTAYDQIVKAAKGRKADLIVIGTHGRTGLSKLFMGSVASRVVSAAHCPVLTVRGK